MPSTITQRSFAARFVRSCLEMLLGLAVAVGAAALLLRAFPEHGQTLKKNAATLYASTFPCRQPMTYAVGGFDERFGISRQEFESAIAEAAAEWEREAGRDLFAPAVAGAAAALTVNLTYDERQQATDTLRGLGVRIDQDKAGYDKLKADHEALVAQYEPRKEAFAAAAAAHDRRVAAYDAEVASWNAKGGAPKPTFDKLNAEQSAIAAEASRLNAERNALNAMVERINANVVVLNGLAKSLNVVASEYNGISAARGDEFEEGTFTGTRAGGTVDVFEFDGRERLVRLLLHEFGHALGLEHVDDASAVMYRLNVAGAPTLVAADVAELRRACELP